MTEGIDYLSQEQRDNLAQQIKDKRRARDKARKEATVVGKGQLDKIIQIILRREPKSDALHRRADQLDSDARRILEVAKERNTGEDFFTIGSESELEKLLQSRERFSDFEATEVLRVYQNVKNHFEEIERIRCANSIIEPGGFILDGQLEWSDHKTWEEKRFDIQLNCQQRMDLADRGAVLFHCHPTEPGSDEFQTRLSSGDYLATVIDRNEVIFCQAGVVIGTSTRRYSYDETQKIMGSLWREAESSPFDPGWEMVHLVHERFGIKSFTIDHAVFKVKET